MLPPNLLIVSIIIFLTTTISTAPVEEKEEVEVEVEATEEVEGELSEEEEDDDDSKSQDKIDEGPVGGQRTTTAAAVASGGSGASSSIQDQSAPSGQSAGGGTIDGIAGSAAVQTGDSSSVDSSAGGPISSAASQPTDPSGPPGPPGPPGPSGPSGPSGSSGSSGSLSGVSAVQTHHTGSDGVDSESNSNGQKLLNGGAGGGGADSQTGASDSLGDGISHLDFTGTVASSSHNFLLSLMGGGDPFGPGVHINIPGHMTPPTQLDSTVISSGVTAAQHSGTSLDSPADLAYHINIDHLGVDLTSLSSEPDQSPSSSVSSSAYPAAQGDGTDTPDVNGNGRQTLLTDTNTAADQFVSFTDLQTEVTAGGADSVTSLHVDLTASGLGLTHDVTESTPVILHTASGGSTHTDLVTMAADSTGTDSGHPAVTDHTQMAGSVTEQYNPSGQGPEGAENVELEDTC